MIKGFFFKKFWAQKIFYILGTKKIFVKNFPKKGPQKKKNCFFPPGDFLYFLIKKKFKNFYFLKKKQKEKTLFLKGKGPKKKPPPFRPRKKIAFGGRGVQNFAGPRKKTALHFWGFRKKIAPKGGRPNLNFKIKKFFL